MNCYYILCRQILAVLKRISEETESLPLLQVYLEPSQISKMEPFAEIVHGF